MRRVRWSLRDWEECEARECDIVVEVSRETWLEASFE